MDARVNLTELDMLCIAIEHVRDANGSDESPTLAHLDGILQKALAGESLTEPEIAEAKAVTDEWIAGFRGPCEG